MYQNPLFRHAMLFGSFVGAVLVSVSFVFYMKGLSIAYDPNLALANNFLVAAGVYLGVRKYRNEVMQRMISYGGAFVAGVLIMGAASFVYALFVYVLARFDPMLIKETIDLTEKNLLQSGVGEERTELYMSIYKHLTPGIFAFAQGINKMIHGLFFSLILAFFLKRDKNLFYNKPIDKFKQSENQ